MYHSVHTYQSTESIENHWIVFRFLTKMKYKLQCTYYEASINIFFLQTVFGFVENEMSPGHTVAFYTCLLPAIFKFIDIWHSDISAKELGQALLHY